MLSPKLYCILAIALACSTSCTPLRKKAERSEARGDYYLATQQYQRLYRQTAPQRRSERAYYAYRSGECLLRLRQLSKALGQYKHAERYAYPDSMLLLRLGYTLHGLGRYVEASNYYQRYLLCDSTSHLARIGLEGIRLAQRDTLPERGYNISSLQQTRHTASDYAPYISGANNALYFASRRAMGRGIKKSSIQQSTGERTAEIYRLEREPQGQWSHRLSLDSLGRELRGELSSICFSPSGQRVYYSYTEGRGKSEVYTATRLSNGSWGRGERLAIWELRDREVMGVSLNASGTKLFFSSRDSLLSSDIYEVDIDGAKVLSQPRRLPSSINTPAEELSPYAVGDSLLYFASDGHASYGGFDLYRAKWQCDGSWSVEHLPAPLNSSADELGIAVDKLLSIGGGDLEYEERGIIASSREDARGRTQLYEYRRTKQESRIDGRVLDREGYPIVGANIRLVARRGKIGEELATSRQDGSFGFAIGESNQYILRASHEGYLSQYAELTTELGDSNETFQIDFRLASKRIPEVLESLYYAFDSDTILPESKASLDELYKILVDNPSISIRLSAHTDRVGSDAYNEALSLRRAKRVVEALQAYGIDPTRIEAEGLGSRAPHIVGGRDSERYPFLREGDCLDSSYISKLKSHEEQAICDALNRRTTFRCIE